MFYTIFARFLLSTDVNFDFMFYGGSQVYQLYH